MGFRTVYQTLMDVFPQVDIRILRAVALEHAKDPDTAVEAVLIEVIPFMESQSLASKPTIQIPEEESEHEDQSDLLRRRPNGSGKNVDVSPARPNGSGKNVDASPARPSSAAWVDDLRNDLMSFDRQFCSSSSSSSSKQLMNVEPVLSPNVPEEVNQLHKGIDSEEFILLQKSPYQGENPRSGSNHISPVVSDDLVPEVAKCNGSDVFFDTENEISSPETFQQIDTELAAPEQITHDVSASVVEKEACSSGGFVGQNTEEKVSHASMESVDVVAGAKEPEVSTQVDATTEVGITEAEQGTATGGIDFGIRSIPTTAGEKAPEVTTQVDAAIETEAEQRTATGDVDFEVLSSPTNVSEKAPEVTTQVEAGITEAAHGTATCDMDFEIPSSPSNVSENGVAQQDINIEALDDFIEAGKNNKKTLFSAVESVMNKMKEVEIKEKEAEQAELEAATAGLDIQVQVEELKEMLSHAKEANDMHAGEVYGEKAILATEVKELQARVLNLSEERDTAITIIDEMHQTLEERLAAAEELLAAAEKQKQEKEGSARKALSEEQSVMEKVVQESKILQEAAEENSKLREFLMDRGHVVDMLQGEISVICQDVRLLKEKIDNRVPLSQSISSSQTSCILASSGSSSTRTAIEVDVFPAMGSKHTSPASSVRAESPRSNSDLERMISREELLDEEWDLLDHNDAGIVSTAAEVSALVG